jgi:hypothetical protein
VTRNLRISGVNSCQQRSSKPTQKWGRIHTGCDNHSCSFQHKSDFSLTTISFVQAGKSLGKTSKSVQEEIFVRIPYGNEKNPTCMSDCHIEPISIPTTHKSKTSYPRRSWSAKQEKCKPMLTNPWSRPRRFADRTAHNLWWPLVRFFQYSCLVRPTYLESQNVFVEYKVGKTYNQCWKRRRKLFLGKENKHWFFATSRNRCGSEKPQKGQTYPRAVLFLEHLPAIRVEIPRSFKWHPEIICNSVDRIGIILYNQ